MKLIGIFLMLLASFTAANQDDGTSSRCKREVVESYNLNGYLSKRKMHFYICPAMKLSCCSMYDQFMMFTNWRDNVRPKLVKYYKGIELKYKHMKDLIKEVFKFDVKKLIEKLHMDEKHKDKILQSYIYAKDRDIPGLIDKSLEMLQPNSDFMMKARSTFYCSICDFSSHRYINIPKKEVRISEISCGEIAKNTINYSYFLNVELTKVLMEVSKILIHFSENEAAKPVVIRNASKIRKAVTKCANVFKAGAENFTPCKSYCEHYKFNANSPVLEGYQVFFNDMINAFEMFIKSNSEEEKTENDEDDGRRLGEILGPKKAFNLPERQLNDDIQTFNFSAADLDDVHDPYDEKAVDPNYDEFVLNKMFSFQQSYEKDRQQGYVNFIKNKLHFIDVEYDYDNADDNDIFKTNSHVIVDLENFSTKVTPEGVDIEKHVHSTNIDKSMKDLVAHLKSRSRYKILYEKLDPALLEQVNDINNDDVRNFHRDHFLHFNDFSLTLKQEELILNYDNLKKTSKKSGYNIKL